MIMSADMLIPSMKFANTTGMSIKGKYYQGILQLSLSELLSIHIRSIILRRSGFRTKGNYALNSLRQISAGSLNKAMSVPKHTRQKKHKSFGDQLDRTDPVCLRNSMRLNRSVLSSKSLQIKKFKLLLTKIGRCAIHRMPCHN